MKNINITLSDTNYTEHAKTKLTLDPAQFEIFKELVQIIEGGLYEQRAAYIGIDGLFKDSVKLTITEIEQSH
jgi:hypothetical protein